LRLSLQNSCPGANRNNLLARGIDHAQHVCFDLAAFHKELLEFRLLSILT
jgi:hypothetical protein